MIVKGEGWERDVDEERIFVCRLQGEVTLKWNLCIKYFVLFQFENLRCSREGLTIQAVEERRVIFGHHNKFEEKKVQELISKTKAQNFRTVHRIFLSPIPKSRLMLFIGTTEMEQIEQDPDYIMLSRQFKATAMELISAKCHYMSDIYAS